MFKLSKEIKNFIAPIKIGEEILQKRVIYNVYFENNLISELSPLTGLHPETIKIAQNHVESILSKLDIETVKINYNNGLFNPEAPFFNLTSFQHTEIKNLPSSVIFCIESLIINILFPKNYPVINSCYLDFLKRVDADEGVIKVKIGRNRAKEDQEKINHYINNTNLLIRLDGNQSLTADELNNIISNHPTDRFQYLEDPFVNNEEAIKYYVNNSNVPLAWDENLNLLLADSFKRHPLRPFVKFAIIKPNLQGGLHKAIKIARVLKKQDIKTVISSSFEGEIGLSTLNNIHFIFKDLFEDYPGLGTYNYFK